MYGFKEVVFVNMLFNLIEDMLGFECYIIKIGVMDEECCMMFNLKVCIKEVKEWVVFINIGFLDWMGDEIYILMEVGVVICKNDMKMFKWF